MSPTLPRLALAAIVALTALPPTPAQAQPKSRTYTFCFWNVENLFDDRLDKGRMGVDDEFDKFFAQKKEMLAAKLDRVCDVLLGKALNGGRGPDILALAEVESKRAVELLRGALNARIRDKNQHYTTVAYLDPGGGRSIATAVLVRSGVTIDEKKTKLLGRSQRMLKVHLVENKHELVIMASHWTSRVSDKTGRGREGYADAIFKDFVGMYEKSALVDYLVCGDFNDTPDDKSVVTVLGAIGDLNKVLEPVKKGTAPYFFNPFADFVRQKKGTHYFAGNPYVFDHVVVSPGLLDGSGWSYVPKSARIVEELQFRGRPDRFGGAADGRPLKNRGASDHYPVVVELRVQK